MEEKDSKADRSEESSTDNFLLRLQPGSRVEIKIEAAKAGINMNDYLLECVEAGREIVKTRRKID